MLTEVKVRYLDENPFELEYAKDGDAGVDLRSNSYAFALQPGERKLVRTGVAIELPDRYVGLVHPRSGLANIHGVTVLNTPGTVDSGYRGEIMVNLINLGHENFRVNPGDRIAQLVIQHYVKANFSKVPYLATSERGTGGHGSTGVQ